MKVVGMFAFFLYFGPPVSPPVGPPVSPPVGSRNFEIQIFLKILSKFQVFPLCYVLMTCKTTEAYCSVFKFIEEKLFLFEPAMFMTDFEEGMRSAIRKCWPNVMIKGCWFHYKRAVNKKCTALGMKRFKERQLKRMLANIPLLPECQTLEGYASAQFFAKKNKLDKAFSGLFTYYKYWLNQVRFLPTLLPS